MAVRQQGSSRVPYPPYDEDDEDHLATVIMADRAEDDAIRRMLRPGGTHGAPQRRHPPVEAEGVLLDEEDTPDTEHRMWPAGGLTPSVQEWEVTEQMPMPSATPPQFKRAVAPPVPPAPPPSIDRAAFVSPAFDITPEVPRHGRAEVAPEWSEPSTPATLSTQPPFEEDDEISFVPLIAMLAVPAFAVFFAAMWLVG
ncbi:MAG: hypothetical protein AAF602_07035 [Myxococcota bacterium]